MTGGASEVPGTPGDRADPPPAVNDVRGTTTGSTSSARRRSSSRGSVVAAVPVQSTAGVMARGCCPSAGGAGDSSFAAG